MKFLEDINQETNKILSDAIEKKKVYHNIKQVRFTYRRYPDVNGVFAKKRTFVGGIGTGKTTVMATNQYIKTLQMPRSFGYFLGKNYKQILNTLLPSTLACWERFGLVENIDYVVCKAPPKSWPRPMMGNKNFEHVITFSNGSGYALMAADRKDLNRGSSFHHGDMDEAGLISEETYNNIVAGRLRGDRHKFEGSEMYAMETQFTSMPFLASGMWVLGRKELARIKPYEYFYQESTTADNIEVLGPDYIERLREAMDPYTFAREVENQRMMSGSNAFYSSLKEEHLYECSIIYKEDSIKDYRETSFKDADTNPKNSLSISVDTGLNFNCMTVWQYNLENNTESVVNNFYVMKPMLLNDMIDKFIAYYTNHENRNLYMWGDRNNNKTEANNNLTLFEQIAERLRAKGWIVKIMYEGADNPKHKLKHEFMNDVLREQMNWPKVRISKEKALETYYSMHNALGNHDYTKDKSQERKLLNSPSRYMATDLSDTVDYYLFAKWYLDYKSKMSASNWFYSI